MTDGDATARYVRARSVVVLARGNHRATFEIDTLGTGGARLIGDLALARGERVTVLLDLSRVLAVVAEVVGAVLLEDTGKYDITIVFQHLPVETRDALQAYLGQQRPQPPGVVLVVDDDPHVRGGLDRDLAALGRAARLAASPRDAIAYLGDETVRYDCVIVDHCLGTRAQLDFIHYLKTHFPALPRILLSEGRVEVLEREVLAGRVQAVLGKPWQLDDLAEALDVWR